MFTLTQSITRSTRPLLAAMLLVFATNAAAQASTAPSALSALKRAAERIATEAIVVSTAHYQATLSLTCNATQGFCTGNFPTVANRRRLNLTRMSCYMRSSTYASFAAGRILLEPGGAIIEFLPVDHSTDWGYHVLNRAIDMQIVGRQYFSVALQLVSGGQATEAQCTAHGTLETLQ